jgi:SAM-dependent methyltransferase
MSGVGFAVPAAGSRVADDAREANRCCYESAAVVQDYVLDDYHAVRRQIAVELLVEALDRDGSTEPVLELGSGPASMLDLLPDDGRQRTNADLSMEALLETKHHRVCLDATRPLPFRSQAMAAVVIGELIEHVFAPDAMLREIHRVLRPDGAVVVTTPNLATLYDRVRFLFGRTPRHVDALHPYLRLHIRPFTKRSLVRLLDETQFDVAAVRSNFVGWKGPSGRWWHWRGLAKLLPGLGGSLIVLAYRRG